MQKANIIIFAVVLVVFFVLALLPPDPKAAKVENLTGMPEINIENVLNRGFADGYETYLSDNMAFRSTMISFARTVEDIQGLKPDSGFIEKTERYLLWFDRIMEVFYRKTDVEADYAGLINKLADAAHDGVNMFSLLVPTQAEFLEGEYKNLSDSQRDTINHINGLLSERVNIVDAYSVLQKRTDEYIYFRTDHHWTALGAYYAYRAFCEQAGISPVPLEDFTEHKAEGFLGHLYNLRPSPNLEAHADILYFYTMDAPVFEELIVFYGEPPVPFAGEPPQYWVFLHGDLGYINVTTEVKNGRTAVILKDSYANSFVPFLAPNYERIVVIDPRTIEEVMENFSIREELDKYDDIDLLILNYTFSATFEDIVTQMNKIY